MFLPPSFLNSRSLSQQELILSVPPFDALLNLCGAALPFNLLFALPPFCHSFLSTDFNWPSMVFLLRLMTGRGGFSSAHAHHRDYKSSPSAPQETHSYVTDSGTLGKHSAGSKPDDRCIPESLGLNRTPFQKQSRWVSRKVKNTLCPASKCPLTKKHTNAVRLAQKKKKQSVWWRFM